MKNFVLSSLMFIATLTSFADSATQADLIWNQTKYIGEADALDTQVLIKNEDDYRHIWQTYTDHLIGGINKPAVDFTKESLVAMSRSYFGIIEEQPLKVVAIEYLADKTLIHVEQDILIGPFVKIADLRYDRLVKIKSSDLPVQINYVTFEKLYKLGTLDLISVSKKTQILQVEEN